MKTDQFEILFILSILSKRSSHPHRAFVPRSWTVAARQEVRHSHQAPVSERNVACDGCWNRWAITWIVPVTITVSNSAIEKPKDEQDATNL